MNAETGRFPKITEEGLADLRKRIGVPDETRGQVVKAFIVTDRAPSDAYVEELKTFTRERLAQHEFPRHIEFVSELPKTPSGKVHRKALRDRTAAAAH